jgi:hypothetical protein
MTPEPSVQVEHAGTPFGRRFLRIIRESDRLQESLNEKG